MPGASRAEFYFILGMMVLIIIVCVVAVFAFFKTYKKEMGDRRPQNTGAAERGETDGPPESV
jgi:hypothetical protein